MSTEEETIEASIETYKSQLAQVESALIAAGKEKNEDLIKLKDDLQELIALTEESLLNIKKNKLLSVLDDKAGSLSITNETKKNAVPESSLYTDMDAEFAAFQATLAGDVTPKQSLTSTSEQQLNHSSSSSASEDESSSDENDLKEMVPDFSQLIGSKCRAPFSQSWGGKSHHNAMVISVEPFNIDEDFEPKVKVFFTHPTHRSMVPCQYFLENKCNYEDNCRYSHGYLVNLGDLQEYKDHDHGNLKLESKCLVKYTDNVWYPAVIVDVFPDHTYKVMFDENHELLNVSLEAVLPIDDSISKDESEDENLTLVSSSDSEDESEALPVYLWRPGSHQTADILGGWEQHTRGIASKLMTKMGYMPGEGLGKRSEGRVEPVPIQLLPQGKSLDKIMELKALAGDRDLYDVMKKRKHHQKKINKNAGKSYEKAKKKEKRSVFDFINKKLMHSVHKVEEHSHSKHHNKHHEKLQATKQHKQISEKDLKNKSEKGLNIQIFQTLEEMKSTEKEIARLKSILSRNEGRDPRLTKQVQSKLSSFEEYLKKLKSSENSLQKHKNSRKDNKKLTVF